MGKGITSIIRKSHKRSAELGVDKKLIAPGKVLSAKELNKALDEAKLLLDVARPIVQDLLASLRSENEMLVVLTNREGVVLQTAGALRNAQMTSLQINPGVLLDEESVGTNAIGVALYSKTAIQVSWKDHYAELFFPWTCSAAPLFMYDGTLLGSIALLGPIELEHPHTLALVEGAARSVEDRLHNDQVHNELTNAQHFAFSIMNNLSYGLMVVNHDDELYWVNDTACRTVNIRRTRLLNTPITQLITNWPAIRKRIRRLGRITDEELQMNLPEGEDKFIFNGFRVMDFNGGEIGICLNIRPFTRMLSLVNKITGMQASYSFKDVVAKSPRVRKAVNMARTAAKSPSTILITGESGTGKEVFAQAIHQASERKEGGFVALNCGAIATSLIESELFGYVDGAFTGARKGGHLGKFELASKGTLFLDEIGEMPLEMQVKLLRALQERAITRVGGDKLIPVDVRIIAATNKDLEKEIAEGRFRQDLYFRLNVVNIHLPPLRERQEDIVPLIQHFLRVKSSKLIKPIPEFSPELMGKLLQYSWPGNIRELENKIEKAVLFEGALPDYELEVEKEQPLENSVRKLNTISDLEREAIVYAIEELNGNMSKVAKSLGIGRNTLYLKMKKYEIPLPRS